MGKWLLPALSHVVVMSGLVQLDASVVLWVSVSYSGQSHAAIYAMIDTIREIRE